MLMTYHMTIAWDIANYPWVVDQSQSRTKFEFIIICINYLNSLEIKLRQHILYTRIINF